MLRHAEHLQISALQTSFFSASRRDFCRKPGTDSLSALTKNDDAVLQLLHSKPNPDATVETKTRAKLYPRPVLSPPLRCIRTASFEDAREVVTVFTMCTLTSDEAWEVVSAAGSLGSASDDDGDEHTIIDVSVPDNGNGKSVGPQKVFNELDVAKVNTVELNTSGSMGSDAEETIINPAHNLAVSSAGLAGYDAAFAAAAEVDWAKGHVELELRSVKMISKEAGGVMQLGIKGERRVLPIHMGEFETQALMRHAQRDGNCRPMTHDLLASVVSAAGCRVARIDITEFKRSTYYACVHITRRSAPHDVSNDSVSFDAETEELDARPSDAVNLAVRTGARIFAKRGVVDLMSRMEP